LRQGVPITGVCPNPNAYTTASFVSLDFCFQKLQVMLVGQFENRQKRKSEERALTKGIGLSFGTQLYATIGASSTSWFFRDMRKTWSPWSSAKCGTVAVMFSQTLLCSSQRSTCPFLSFTVKQNELSFLFEGFTYEVHKAR
jgi:hypothetical protein